MITGHNERQPPRRVVHAELERVREDNPFLVLCPGPDCFPPGILTVPPMISTGPKEWRVWTDQCSSCGQRVIYEDTHIGGKRLHRPIPVLLQWVHEKDPPSKQFIMNPVYIGEQREKRKEAWSLGVWLPKQVSRDGALDLCFAEPLSSEAPFKAGDEFEMWRGPHLLARGRVGFIHPWGFESAYDDYPPWPDLWRTGSGLKEELEGQCKSGK